MFYVVYVDLLFLINFLIETILLIGYGSLTRKKRKWKRIIAGGIIGGILTVGYYQLVLSWAYSYVLLHPSLRLIRICPVFLILMVSYSMRSAAELFRHGCLFFLLHILVYGMFGYLISERGGTFFSLVLVGGVAGIVLVIDILLKKYRIQTARLDRFYEIELVVRSQKLRGIGFYDSGNTLHDPVFGKPVIIAEKTFLSQRGLLYDGMPVFMIPYHSVGKEKGLLPAITADKLLIYGKDTMIEEHRVMVALKEGRLSAKGQYQVLLHADMLV